MVTEIVYVIIVINVTEINLAGATTEGRPCDYNPAHDKS